MDKWDAMRVWLKEKVAEGEKELKTIDDMHRGSGVDPRTSQIRIHGCNEAYRLALQNMDALEPARCTCRFVGVGLALDAIGCAVHTKRYPCGSPECGCSEYRPRSEPVKPDWQNSDGWPRCVCGHIAQEH